MEAFWWFVSLLVILVGLVGTVVPFVPGSVLIFAGAILNHFTVHGVGWPTLIVLFAIMVISQLVDLCSGAVGARYFGATRWGAIGGILGALVGIFFGLPGLFLGPLAGALLGELLGGKGILPAGRSTWGTLLGTTAGLIVKLLLAIAMVGVFALSALSFRG